MFLQAVIVFCSNNNVRFSNLGALCDQRHKYSNLFIANAEGENLFFVRSSEGTGYEAGPSSPIDISNASGSMRRVLLIWWSLPLKMRKNLFCRFGSSAPREGASAHFRTRHLWGFSCGWSLSLEFVYFGNTCRTGRHTCRILLSTRNQRTTAFLTSYSVDTLSG